MNKFFLAANQTIWTYSAILSCVLFATGKDTLSDLIQSVVLLGYLTYFTLDQWDSE